ncbi:hypothetical protein ACFYUV_24710 [Nonomuraea sp. NPDC003560]|uniref:hypothetical protein n=1 Tax=Nonomuraea sp. NPDC003560 TaxID=3364341 RepID=UPI0036D1AAAD
MFVVVITVVLTILGTLAALVQNVAASSPQWPWGLDYLRRHPWPSVGVLAILIVLGSVVLLRAQSVKASPQGEEADEPTKSAKHADFSNSTIHGDVLISQGELSPVVQSGRSPADILGTDTDVEEGTARAVIPYIISNFLGTGGWEEAIFDGLRDVGEGIEGLPVEPPTRGLSGAPALIVVVSAAQFERIKRKTTARIRAAQRDHPAARLLFYAVDRSEEPFNEDDGRALAKAAGYSEECTRVVTCPTVDVLRREISSHVRNVVRAAIVQARLGSADNDEGGTKGLA